MNAPTVTMDVRDEIRRGHDPFVQIMNVVGLLQAGESLLVIAPFKPTPLLQVMAQKGFDHRAEPVTDSKDWRVLFERGSRPGGGQPVPPLPPATSTGGHDAPAPILDLDTRGLEPPEPLVRILEALTTLPRGAGMQARTDRRPMHLYDHLAHRGFTGISTEEPDGSYLTLIQHA